MATTSVEPPPEAVYYLPTNVTVLGPNGWELGFLACERSQRNLHVITAWNPGPQRFTDEVNYSRNQELLADIEALGLRAVPARGSDPNSPHFEDSWAIEGMEEKTAIELGRKYGQVAVFSITPSTQTVVGCFAPWRVSRGSLISIGYEHVAEWLLGNESKALKHLRNYFEIRSSKNAWQGQHFEWFASRIDRKQFTEVDLAAIRTLSVDLPAQTARELIEDKSGVLGLLLRDCENWISARPGFTIADSDSSWLLEDQPFSNLYEELRKSDRFGLGAVVASKLMAARWPQLIPIRDSRVESMLGMKSSKLWWEPIKSFMLRVDNFLGELEVQREDFSVSNLRKLDVVLWMEAKERGF